MEDDEKLLPCSKSRWDECAYEARRSDEVLSTSAPAMTSLYVAT